MADGRALASLARVARKLGSNVARARCGPDIPGLWFFTDPKRTPDPLAITARLPEGSVVSTPRHHTGVVITEYGAADLSGRTVRERAAALAGIAHPDFRDELHERAATLGRH